MKKLIISLFYLLPIVIFAQEYELGLPYGHSDFIWMANFDNNNEYLVTASDDKTAKLWDLKSKRLIHDLKGHTKGVKIAKISPNNKFIMTGSHDETVKIWNLRTGELIHNLKEHDGFIYAADFSPNNKVILTATYGSVKIWNLSDGKLIGEIRKEKLGIKSAQFDNTGKNIIIIHNTTIDIWNSNTRKLIHSFSEHENQIESFSLSQNGSYLCSSSGSEFGKRQLILWDLKSKKKIWSVVGNSTLGDGFKILSTSGINHKKNIESIRFDPNDEFVLTASSDQTTKLWKVSSGKLIHSFNKHPGALRNADFSNDGALIVSISKSSTRNKKRAFRLNIWDLKTKKIRFSIDGTGEPSGAKFSPDDKTIITYGRNLFLWNPDSGKLKDELKNRTSNPSYAIMEEFGNYLVKRDSNLTKIFDLSTMKLNNILNAHQNLVNTTKYSPNGRYIATSGMDNKAIIWSNDKKKVIHKLVTPQNAAWVNFSPKENFCVTTSYINWYSNRDHHLWSLDSGKLIRKLNANNENLMDIAFSPDEKLIATVTRDQTSKRNGIIQLSEVISGKIVWKIQPHDGNVNRITFINDGSQILTTGDDGFAKLTDVQTGQSIFNFKHRFQAFGNALSPNEKFLCVYSSEYGKKAYLKMWNLNSYELLWEKQLPNTDNVTDIQFNIDGSKVLTSSNDNIATCWETLTGKRISNFIGHSDNVRDVYLPAGKDILITSSDDNFIIFWDIKTAKPLLKLIFIDNEPIWITEEGYYYSTKKATSKLFYKNNLQTIGFEQLDLKYNRPDKVLKVLSKITKTDNTALTNAYKKAWIKRINKMQIDSSRFRQDFSVPKNDIVNRKKIEYQQFNNDLELHIKAKDDTYNLDRYNVWINEVPVFGRNGIQIRDRKKKTLDAKLTLKLSQGINKIETSVVNTNGIESYRSPIYVNYIPEKATKVKLYFVGIGVDKYQEESNDLNYSVKDIKDLSIQLKEKYGSQIQIDTLFNQNVTISNVKKLKEQLKSSKVDDKVIISFSGHGLLSKDLDYYLATHNVNFSSPEENGLPYEDLENLLDGIPSRQKLLLIDACHSGEVDKEEVESIHKVEKLKEGLKGSIGITTKKPKLGIKNSFELMKELFNNIDRATGATVISAAAGTEFAQERGNLKNGVFTYCILNQLKEKETISVSELKQLVSEQVKEITNGLQQPTSRNETIENDWKVW